MSEVSEQDLLSAFESAEPSTSTVESETPAAEAAPSESSTEVPAVEPAQPLKWKDDDVIEVKIDGQVVRKTVKEILQTQAMLPGSYTKKTQELAEQRRAFEAQRQEMTVASQQAMQQAQAAQQQLQQLQSYMRNPQNLAALYLAAQSGQAPQGQPDVQAPAAPLDLNQFRQQVLQEAQQTFESKWQALQQTQEAAQKSQALVTDFTTHASSLLTKHPALAAIDGLDEVIFDQVAKMHPANPEEAKAYMETVVDGMASKISSYVTASQKDAVLTAAKAKQGISGAKATGAVTPAAVKYDKKRSFGNDSAMDDAVDAFIRNAQGAL